MNKTETVKTDSAEEVRKEKEATTFQDALDALRSIEAAIAGDIFNDGPTRRGFIRHGFQWADWLEAKFKVTK
jgi:hypothetical protein